MVCRVIIMIYRRDAASRPDPWGVTPMSKSRLFRLALALGLVVSGVLGLRLARAGRGDDGPKKVALLVGVNRYKARILSEKPLSFAERDVEELAKVLKGQGFEVRALTGAEATKEGIDKALDLVLKGREASDLVLLGFAGHGVQMPLVDGEGKPVVDGRGKALGDAYFCPVNAVFGKGESMVSLTRLFERLDREGGINLMLVDACRDNPDPDRSLGGRVRSLSGDELNGRLPGNSAILFSCSSGQRSLETPKAGGGHGVFIHHVIEGLKGQAADPATGEVGWDDLVSYVRKNVNTRAKEWEPELGKYADKYDKGRLQDPHQISNMVATPILARVDLARRPIPVAVDRKPTGTITDLNKGQFTNSIGMKFAPIPGGEFLMGSPESDKDASDDEKPQHRVRISPFQMQITEVTRGQFRRFVDETNYRLESERDGKGGYGIDAAGEWKKDPLYSWLNPGFSQAEDHPVVNVSWNDAVAFATWLSQKEGKTYRLPTEAEWEYGCRGRTTTRYQHGDDTDGLVAVGNVADASARSKFPDWAHTLAGNDGVVYTSAVGQYRANGFGLYDMHGNVWEWCSDGYKDTYYKESPVADPPGLLQASDRVYRGGGWSNNPRSCRSACRIGFTPEYRFNFLGFRLSLVPVR
jgi:formylglycine-generating enzyme required for sulfatase activity